MSAPTNHAFAPLLAGGPVHAEVPPSVDVDSVVSAVAADGVFAPAADEAGLAAVVADADGRGVDLSVIVLEQNPARDTDLRDLATTVGKSEGGTVLVLSPGAMGSYSDSIPRVRLETAQDRSFGESAAVTADRFSHQITEPGPPWTLYTVLVVAVVAVATAVTFAAKWRRRAVADTPGRNADAAISSDKRPESS